MEKIQGHIKTIVTSIENYFTVKDSLMLIVMAIKHMWKDLTVMVFPVLTRLSF